MIIIGCKLYESNFITIFPRKMSTNDCETIMSAIKSIDSAELFKLLKAVISEIEKKTKQEAKGAKPTKKAGSAPKGVSPPQLRKPRAWVEYTLKNALENGWESFTIHQKRKDKVSGDVTEEDIEMPESIMHNGKHIYDGSIDEKNPEGRCVKHKEAMSLSKQRKDTGHPTYAIFDSQYEPADDSTESEKSDSDSAVSTKKADKEKEKEASKLMKEEEKRKKMEEKEQEKKEKKTKKTK